jgi:hypothetical protein
MESVTLIPIKVATKGTDLYEEIKKCCKGGISNIENSWTSDEWGAKYGRKEHWRVFASCQRGEGYNGSDLKIYQ